jgi:PAS domain S-box-containing protein
MVEKLPVSRRTAPGAHAGGFWENLCDGFYTVDRDWRFSYVNRAAEKSLGRRRSELLGHSLWESFPQVVDSETFRVYHRSARDRVRLCFEQPVGLNGGAINIAVRPSPHGLAVSFRETGGRDRVRGRVLLVDDHRDVSGMLQTLLEDEGYFVSIAEDLDDAQSALDYLPMDVVILDDRLPSGRGSSVTEQAERHGIRMLVMSGHPASIEQFGRSTGFIAKPFRGSELMKRLKRLIA